MKASPVQWPLLYPFGRRVPCTAEQRSLFGRHPVPSGRAGPSGANAVGYPMGYHIRSLSIPGVYAWGVSLVFSPRPGAPALRWYVPPDARQLVQSTGGPGV